MKLEMLIVLLGLSIIQTAQGRYCPGNNRCYYYYHNRVTHDAAESACVNDLGAHLVAIDSQKEQRLINHYWTVTAGVGAPDPNEQVPDFNPTNALWIGAKRTSGSWGWTDGTTWSYTNWAANEPSSSFDCGYMRASDGKWATKPCDNPTRYTTYYICETPEGGSGR